MTLVSWVSILVMCIFGWISYIQRKNEAKKRNQLQADLNQKLLEEQKEEKRKRRELRKNTLANPIRPVSLDQIQSHPKAYFLPSWGVKELQEYTKSMESLTKAMLEAEPILEPIQPVSFQELKDGHLLPVTYVSPNPSDAFNTAIQPKQAPKNVKKKEPISYDDPKRDISL